MYVSRENGVIIAASPKQSNIDNLELMSEYIDDDDLELIEFLGENYAHVPT